MGVDTCTAAVLIYQIMNAYRGSYFSHPFQYIYLGWLGTQGPQNLESLVQAEMDASQVRMNGLPFSFSGVLFFEEAVHNCETSMYAILPFIAGSQSRD